MQTYKIAVVAGDGIGPEVVASGIAIMDAAGEVAESSLEYVAAPAGAGLTWSAETIFPRHRWRSAGADAILLGACGLPDVRRPDGTELTPQITLVALDLYAGCDPPAASGCCRQLQRTGDRPGDRS